RYCYGNQPQIGLWNVVQLANALIPLVGAKEPLEEALQAYGETYTTEWRRILAEKFGIDALDGDEDDKLVNDCFDVLQDVETDMTLFFRLLAKVPLEGNTDNAVLVEPLSRA